MKYRNGMKGQVYCLHDVEHNICRIGKTDSKTLGVRQNQQVAYYPFDLVVYSEDVPNAICFENFLHKIFKEKHKKGDWFNITPVDFKKAVDLARLEYDIAKKVNDDYHEHHKMLCMTRQSFDQPIKRKANRVL